MPTVVTDEMIQELAKAGVMYGHKRSRTHPRMKPYVSGTRQEIELLDPQATWDGLETAGVFLQGVMQKGGLVLCVATSPSAKEAIRTFAEAHKFPYVTNRWLGGTLTNHKVIQGRLKYYHDLQARREVGELQKYTKKEQSQFTKEIGKLEKAFSGLAAYTRLPDALLVVDIEREATAVREALQLKIPVVAVLDTNDNPERVNYPIFANDHARTSIEWVLGKLEIATKPTVAA